CRDRLRPANHPGRQERGDGRHRYGDRIEKIAGGAQSETHARDDKGELSDLSETESRLNRRPQSTSSKKRPERHSRDFSDDDGYGQDRDRRPVQYHELWIDKHADRHKEDGSKHVPHRLNEMFDLFLFAGFGNERSSQKGAERHRVAERLRKQSDEEADT